MRKKLHLIQQRWGIIMDCSGSTAKLGLFAIASVQSIEIPNFFIWGTTLVCDWWQKEVQYIFKYWTT